MIVALRELLKGKISLRLQYALWALVLVRLLLPFSLVESAISVSNWLTAPAIREADAAVEEYQESLDAVWEEFLQSGETPPEQEIERQVQQVLYDRTYERIEQEYAQTGTVVPEVQIRNEAQQRVERISLTARITQALPYLWVGGMVLMAAVLAVANLHFAWKLRRRRKAIDLPGVPLKVYLTDCVATPCLFGLIRPCIYLTEEIMTDEKTQRHVITHEMSHYRERDHIWSVLRCVCLVLHWYNPLVWVAAVLSKQDAELSCDERTIQALGEESRTAYGRTLISMTCVRRDPKALVLTATTMLGTKKALKERIKLIAKKPKAALYTLLACLVVVAVAVGCTFTGAPGETKDPTDDTTPTDPSAEATTPPTAEPTKPVEINSEWLTDPVEYLSYEKFFSEERTLTQIANLPWQTSENGQYYILRLDEHGLYIKPAESDTSREGSLYSVPNTEWVKESAYVSYMPTDGRYVYCIRNKNEIVRVELLTGEEEVLYSGGEVMGWFTVHEEGVMYFAAREQEAVVLYRLYIPERELDVLYNKIPHDIPGGLWFSVIEPETNWGAIGWKMMNPEMYHYVNEEFKNPNSQYIGEEWWTEENRDWSKHNDLTEAIFIDGILTDLGGKYNIPYRLVCSYDYRNDVYAQREEFAKRLW